MKPLHVRTPLWNSGPLSSHLGRQVMLKMDALQPVGSFKLRGIGLACQTYVQQGASRLVSSSGGNAGYAVAYAGNRLGVDVTVVVPAATPESMRDLIRRQKAEVLEHGDAWDEAHEHALQLSAIPGTAYIHPFDDPIIWQGHASMIEEVAQTGFRPEAVAVAVGGGGLLCGILQGLHNAGWEDAVVFAVETEGAASYSRSLEAGKVITLDRIDSIAVTLGARRVAEEALSWSEKHPVISWTVSDRTALNACLQFAEDHRVLVEPACGAALSIIYERIDPLRAFGSVLAVVCGGAGVNLDLLTMWDHSVPR